MEDPGEELGQMDHDELLEEVIKLRALLERSNVQLAKAIQYKAALEVVLKEHDSGHSPCSCPEIRALL
jgi:hypothetical protein